MIGNIIFWLCLYVVVLGVPMILIIQALKGDRVEKKNIVKLSPNYGEIVMYFILSSLIFSFLLSLLIFFISVNLHILFTIFAACLFFIFSMDFFILLNHTAYIWNQKIIWNKREKTLSFQKNNENIELNLNSPTLKIVEYVPRESNGEASYPGEEYRVLILEENNIQYELSSLIYDDYSFYKALIRNKNYTSITKQFNFIC
ncbi:MAG: hypothetical protein ABUK01_10660 [Leptospirales bacterium]